MCRLLVYVGKKKIKMADLLTNPYHSIIKQSFECKERFSSPLNGDGFGVGWYSGEREDEVPCVFLSVTPAWNNLNLKRLAEMIESPLLFAHVRAATLGLLTSEANCHPFRFGQFLWMHNGSLSGFNLWRRELLTILPDELFNAIQGTTDSEASFMIFLYNLQKKYPQKSLREDHYSVEEMKAAVNETIRTIRAWNDKYESGPSEMNFVCSNGDTVIATRYINHPTASAVSLYYASGSQFTLCNGEYKMLHCDRRQQCHIIASEPLTENTSDWIPVRRNHMVIVTPKSNLLTFPIEI
eukprot:TRINITY_DN8793_c0_g1_i1.p1 TRINITY_DN8793_c0_g1~~TRINITY_DN8793_c0_g1_i1.p1  ORF type:complete len:296 (-),score=36.58 TRINITY_DN8793_c0_g1_i1:54-941(-)